MTDLGSYALTAQATSQIVCAYASGSITLQGAPIPGWVAIGGFYVPEPVTAVLEVDGNVAPSTQCLVALFAPRLVSASQVNITSQTERRVRSASVALVPGVYYLIAARCYAAAADNAHFGTVRAVSLGAP